jgi:hypothetical protein
VAFFFCLSPKEIGDASVSPERRRARGKRPRICK